MSSKQNISLDLPHIRLRSGWCYRLRSPPLVARFRNFSHLNRNWGWYIYQLYFGRLQPGSSRLATTFRADKATVSAC